MESAGENHVHIKKDEMADFDGEQYSVPIKTVNTTNDSKTRLGAYKSLRWDATTLTLATPNNKDCVIVDNMESAITFRSNKVVKKALKMQLEEPVPNIRQINAGLKYDEAPFNKTGDDTSQTSCTLHLSNEHMPIEQEWLMLIGLINAMEDSPRCD